MKITLYIYLSFKLESEHTRTILRYTKSLSTTGEKNLGLSRNPIQRCAGIGSRRLSQHKLPNFLRKGLSLKDVNIVAYRANIQSTRLNEKSMDLRMTEISGKRRANFWCEYKRDVMFTQYAPSPHAHHINGDDEDNRLSNLMLVCPNCHNIIHKRQKTKKQLESEGIIPKDLIQDIYRMIFR